DTARERQRDRSVMMSSVMPSAKYSCSGSPLILTKGNTAIEDLTGVEGSSTPTCDLAPKGGQNSVDPHWLCYVFECPLAEIFETDLHLATDMTEHSMGDVDAAGFGERFEPRGDVDPIAVKVAALNHHVAQIDANAQDDSLALLGSLVGDR